MSIAGPEIWIRVMIDNPAFLAQSQESQQKRLKQFADGYSLSYKEMNDLIVQNWNRPGPPPQIIILSTSVPNALDAIRNEGIRLPFTPMSPGGQFQTQGPGSMINQGPRPTPTFVPVQPTPAPSTPPAPAGKLSIVKGTYAYTEWQQGLRNGINSAQFKTATDEQVAFVLNHMIDKTNLSVTDFNKDVVGLWNNEDGKRMRVPQLDLERNLYWVELSKPPPKVSFDIPRELNPATIPTIGGPVTADIMINVMRNPYRTDLNNLWQYMLRIDQKEQRSFPGDNTLREPIGILMDDVNVIVNDVWVPMKIIPMVEYISAFQDWRDRMVEILQLRKALGRRCRNDEDPWDETPVNEIPAANYIRLENGNCWDIESLMEYIRGIDGRNDASGFKNYGSNKIWENTNDLKRILDHPLAIAENFRGWMESRDIIPVIGSISDETLNQLYIAAQLLVSRGPAFDEAIKKHLTPRQYDVYMKATGGDAYKNLTIANRTDRSDITNTIRTVIKSEAVANMWNYYNSLSQIEKDALELVEPGLRSDLISCKSANLCVYVLARVMKRAMNRVRTAKGLPEIELNTGES